MSQPRTSALREALGGAHPMAANKVKDALDEYQIGFIRHSTFAVLASADGEGNCDASPKGGTPGFTKVLDPRRLLLPDIGGNRLFQSYENFESNPKAGFVFFIPGLEVTVRVNGRVEVLDGDAEVLEGIQEEALVSNPDDNAGVVQGLLLHVDEAYFHCPRSMQFGQVWDADQIAQNATLSLASLKAD